MDTVKKTNLLDTTEEVVYHDEFGWVSGVISVEAQFVCKDGKRTTRDFKVWRDDLGRWQPISDGYQEGWLRTNRQKCEYDYSAHLEHQQVTNFEISFLWLGKRFSSAEELAQIEVYEADYKAWGGAKSTLREYQIKKNLRVMYCSENGKSGGTFVVTKVFEQPNREDKLCEIKPLIRNKGARVPSTTLKRGERLYKVPYEAYEEAPDEISLFNQPLNEGDLAPFLGKSTQNAEVVNLYWLPVQEASGYTVSLYKKRKRAEEQSRHLYLLEQFAVERNKHWLTLQNLFGRGYILILEAENREGKVVARTRGLNIDSGNLEWF